MAERTGLFRSLFDGKGWGSFGMETASSSAMTKNPVDEAVKQLFVNPSIKRVLKVDYIKFGSGDDTPEVLQNLLNKSSTHSGILHKKAIMVAGENLKYNKAPKESKGAAFTVFTQNAGGQNISLSTVFKKAAFYYELHGAVGLLVKYEGSNLIKMEAVSPINLRAVAPKKDGLVEEWLMRHVFKPVSGSVWKNEERVVPVFNSEKPKKEMLIYVKNPHSTNDFYGLPNYISAFNFIEADYQFGVTINNSAENGFAPKVLATLIGRNLSSEQKTEQATKLKSNFQGADAEQMIVSWVRKDDEKPDFKSLDISNLDKTIDIMASLNDSKILTAHSVVNPSMFGVQVAGKLGNTGVEMDASYQIFRATETLPTRRLLTSSFDLAFAISQWKDVTVDVVDIPIFEELANKPIEKKEEVKPDKEEEEDE